MKMFFIYSTYVESLLLKIRFAREHFSADLGKNVSSTMIGLGQLNMTIYESIQYGIKYDSDFECT